MNRRLRRKLRRWQFDGPLLAEIPKSNLDDETLGYIDRVSYAGSARSTLLRGLITDRIYIVFHAGPRPTRDFTRYAEAQEIKALPTVGRMQ